MPSNVCREVVYLVAKLHRHGYSGLRIMPLLNGDQWSVLIGPRLAFSQLDGSFAALDLRKRCAKFTDSLNAKISDVSPYNALEKLWAGSEEISEETSKRFAEWMQSSQLDDAEYRTWLLTLCGRMAIDPNALPFRADEEAPRINCALFNISTIWYGATGPERITEPWPAPPPGKASSSGPWKPKAPEIAVAQPRFYEGDLVWRSGANHRSDSALDNWYDDNGRSDLG